MSGLKVILLSVSLFLSCFYSTAEEGKPFIRKYKLSSEVKNIRIQAHQAHIRLLKMNKGNTQNALKVQYRTPLKMEEDNSTLVISENDFPNKEAAGRVWKNKKPLMIVWVPKLPVQVAVFGGKVEINKFWKTSVSIFTSGKGSVFTKNTEGNMHISQNTGDIKVDSHKGQLTIQSENSHIFLQSCKGKIKVNSFKGRLTVKKSIGQLSVRSFATLLTVNRFTGRLDFHQEKGDVRLKPMIGSVFGYSKEGAVRGVIQANEVNIETHTGKIKLNLPNSQAWVTAETWEGRIFTPIYFNRIKTGGMDRSKGRLRGKGSKRKGNVSLKSHSGSIRVSQSVN